jgi:hypothetical protein
MQNLVSLYDFCMYVFFSRFLSQIFARYFLFFHSFLHVACIVGKLISTSLRCCDQTRLHMSVYIYIYVYICINGHMSCNVRMVDQRFCIFTLLIMIRKRRECRRSGCNVVRIDVQMRNKAQLLVVSRCENVVGREMFDKF